MVKLEASAEWLDAGIHVRFEVSTEFESINASRRTNAIAVRLNALLLSSVSGCMPIPKWL